MHPTSILSLYFGRQFLLWFVLLLGALLLIVFVIDILELLRRAAGKPDVTLDVVLWMGIYKLPSIGQQIVPFAMLFSAMFTFWRLTRSHELVVARASGVSVWQFLMPVLLVSALVGVIRVTLVDPLGAYFIGRFDRLEEHYLKRKTDSIDISRSGLWLRQGEGEEYHMIHAAGIDLATIELRSVAVFRFSGPDAYDVRIDADRARLVDGRWLMENGVLRSRNRTPKPVAAYEIPTRLTRERIEESFSRPETVSFWGLPRFIEILEATGFAAVRYRLHFQSLLAQPFLYCAMVLLAAVFSLRHTRRGGTLLMVTGGIVTGFATFILTDVVLTLGTSEAIPVLMAAWVPAGISLLLGATALLYLEDG